MTQLDAIEETKHKLKMPKKWKVIIHNDDITPMVYVVELLKLVFHFNDERAQHLMLTVHETGRAVAGSYSREIAQEKLKECNNLNVLNNMTLKVTIEEE